MGKLENPLILSIDDDQDTLKLIEKYVSKSGFNIVAFDRVAKARTFLEEVKPDLILVDIKMPETNGYEFSLSLQNNSKFSSIPVVFLSVLRREQDKAHAFASGAVDYLIKPIDKEKLLWFFGKVCFNDRLDRRSIIKQPNPGSRSFPSRNALFYIRRRHGCMVSRIVGGSLREFLHAK